MALHPPAEAMAVAEDEDVIGSEEGGKVEERSVPRDQNLEETRKR